MAAVIKLHGNTRRREANISWYDTVPCLGVFFTFSANAESIDVLSKIRSCNCQGCALRVVAQKANAGLHRTTYVKPCTLKADGKGILPRSIVAAAPWSFPSLRPRDQGT
jgi:hypothetical protein